jgi:hypothetical protein
MHATPDIDAPAELDILQDDDGEFVSLKELMAGRGYVPPPPPTKPDTLTELPLNEIAYELAVDIYPFDDIAKRYGISAANLHWLIMTPAFKQAVDKQRMAHHAVGNAAGRAKLKCEVALDEFGVDSLVRIANDRGAAAAVRVASIREIRTIAGITEQGRNGGGNIGPVLNIAIHLEDGPGEKSLSVTTVAAPFIEGVTT